jgi:hypothetical protein
VVVVATHSPEAFRVPLVPVAPRRQPLAPPVVQEVEVAALGQAVAVAVAVALPSACLPVMSPLPRRQACLRRRAAAAEGQEEEEVPGARAATLVAAGLRSATPRQASSTQQLAMEPQAATVATVVTVLAVRVHPRSASRSLEARRHQTRHEARSCSHPAEAGAQAAVNAVRMEPAVT